VVSSKDIIRHKHVRLLLVALLITTALPAHSAETLRIGTITIIPLDVYSSAEEQRGAIYRLADRLHIDTRQSVIARFLLFHEGDVYVPARLKETERNLRALSFLKSASVTASPAHDGKVDLTVVTQDAWSIAPETQAGSSGGTTTYGARLSDTNLLGLGKELEVGWTKGLERRRVLFNFNDPAFFAPYLRAHLGYEHNSDGYDREFSLRRPFFSFAAPWASDAFFTSLRQNDRLYAGGEEVSQFAHSLRGFGAAFGAAIDPNDDHADRVTAGFRFLDEDFAPIPDHAGIVSSHEFRYLLLRYEHADNDFLTLNYVDKDLRFEDFDLGRSASIEAAVSPAAFGAPATTEFVRVGGSNGFRLGSRSFVLPSVAASTRLHSGIENAIAEANVLWVTREGEAHPRAFVARIHFDGGWRLDPELQFFADGLSGLRGYRAHAFEGNRAVIINAEERFYLGREVLQLVSPGFVIFADAGNASSGGLADLASLKTDVGAGLRIGLPRTPKNLLRIDLSYALSRDPFGRRGWLVSFSSGQAF